MKKRLFLALIPALMVLAGCANNGGGGMSRAVKYFNDDCLAHEEAFGKASELIPFKGGVKRANPVVNRVGCQISEGGTYNKMRFVATVDDPDNITSATWTRDVYNPYSGAELRNQSNKSVTGYYTIINQGDIDDDGIADELIAENGKGFIVYTLTNIPKDLQFAVTVYLTLENADGTTVSNMYVFNQDADRVGDYAPNETSFLLFSSADPQHPIAQDAETQGDHPENNLASFSVSLEKDGFFSIMGHDGEKNKFVIVAPDNLAKNNASNDYFFRDNTAVPGTIAANFTADYTFYLNKSYELYSSAINVVRKVYISFEYTTWWQGGAYTYLYAFNNSNSEKTFLPFESAGTNMIVTTAEINPKQRPGLIVLRANKELENTSFNWETDLYNQTTDIILNNANEKDCVRINDEAGAKVKSYNFISRS